MRPRDVGSGKNTYKFWHRKGSHSWCTGRDVFTLMCSPCVSLVMKTPCSNNDGESDQLWSISGFTIHAEPSDYMWMRFTHHIDVIMSAIASQITGVSIVCSTVCSGTDQIKGRVTGHCEGNPPVTGGFPSQRASKADNVCIWWRHYDLVMRFCCSPSFVYIGDTKRRLKIQIFTMQPLTECVRNKPDHFQTVDVTLFLEHDNI